MIRAISKSCPVQSSSVCTDGQTIVQFTDEFVDGQIIVQFTSEFIDVQTIIQLTSEFDESIREDNDNDIRFPPSAIDP
jgi:hypothetical protein